MSEDVYTKMEDQAQAFNTHNQRVGNSGDTGIHCHGGVYKGHSIIPRPGGGVMVIVNSRSFQIIKDDGDELRFRRLNEALEYLDSLRERTQAQIDSDPIPF